MKLLISYIFPIYNEAGNIPLLYKSMASLLSKHPRYNYEILFINDGSKDNSLDLLVNIQKKDNRVKVINFSRNFGHQMAVTAGLDIAKGEAIIIMDSDLQDPPQVSFELIKKWEEGYEVVYAQRRSRKDSPFKRLTAKCFYLFLGKMAEIDIPRDTGDFRLIDRKVADSLARFREHNRFLRGLVSYVGFKQVAVQFDREERYAGQSAYPLKKMLKFATDGILGFSTAPLRWAVHFGFIIASISFAFGLYAVAVRIFASSDSVPGWAFLATSILFCSGMQMLLIGIVGEYIGRIFIESQNRPLYIIDNIYSTEDVV